MRSVSDQFLSTALYASHELVVRVEVLSSDVVVATLDTVLAGDVTLDATAAVRGRVDLVIVDDGSLGLVPTTPRDLLAPYGNELRVYRGLRYPSGLEELVSLGIFRIDETAIDDTAAGMQIAIAGQDRACRVIDARFEEPFEIEQGTPVGAAIDEALGLTGFAIDHSTPDAVAPSTTTDTPYLIAEEGADRWQFCLDIARGAGLTLYFNGDGDLVLDTIARTGAPIATLAEGEDGVLVSAGRRWDRSGSFNAVIATGENTGEILPARGVAYDLDPASPTYYYGPFGQVPRFYQSSFLVTDAQAQSAAESLLAKELGTTQRVSFGTFVNPALEPNDIVTITRERAGLSAETHIIDQITLPLTPDGVMTGTTRASQIQ